MSMSSILDSIMQAVIPNIMAQTRAQSGREPGQAIVDSTMKRSHDKIEGAEQKGQKSSKKAKESQTKNDVDFDVKAKSSSSGAYKVDRFIRELSRVCCQLDV